MQLIAIAGMLVAACSVVFALQNNAPVMVTFLLWSFESSLALVLLLAVAVGGLVVALVSTPSTLRRQWVMTRQGKRIKELEALCAGQTARLAELESRRGNEESDLPA